MMTPVGIAFSCPSCSSPLVFKTEYSLAQVCPTCFTINRKIRVEGAGIQKAEPVREELSILQIGATGSYQNEAFEVIGRIQYFLIESYRNHWYILYSNGKTGWLGDWAGNYSLFLESSYTGLEPVIEPVVGGTLALLQSSLEIEVIDIEVIDKVKSIYWEGEVPDQGLLEKNFTSIGLFNTSGQMGIIHTSGVGVPHAYLGKYVELQELTLKNTRVHHEWL
ncbi:hypothetical protein [Rufibacter hautae]|uniref:DUF4178 domain-containing protein n=1 Tax=Rufibacter hautae TaxID=2595005 RepID=A0A5B6TET8_9BACT|nr:hypothetical protein [Rufibacter hautae]KAA3438658.1 hypothetical protein FOA19_15660 [Rufibacter hautae]